MNACSFPNPIQVLGAYFLPRIPVASGAVETLDELEDDFTLEYPKGWVGRRNTLRKGLSISDYSSSGVCGHMCGHMCEHVCGMIVAGRWDSGRVSPLSV